MQRLLALSALASAVAMFALLCRASGTPLFLPVPLLAGASGALAVVTAVGAWRSRPGAAEEFSGRLMIAGLAAATLTMVFTTGSHLRPYLLLPADLVSFAESSFVNDVIKLREGRPLYTDPRDNNSYPYAPGTQVLTFAIAALFGVDDSIPALRLVAFSYVVLAAAVATSVCGLLARLLLPPERTRTLGLWRLSWFSCLLLVSTDPRFNLYNHSLHNDGLALLVSLSVVWLLARYLVAPHPALLVGLALAPAAGFLVKQSLVSWAGLSVLVLFLSRGVAWRRLAALALSAAAATAAVILISRLVGGDHFFYWVFQALGDKQVSLPRSVQHGLQAGIYGAMGLAAGWVLVLRGSDRRALALWLGWVGLFGLEAYTSGIGFQANHLGPGVVLATCWFLVAVVGIWPQPKDIPVPVFRAVGRGLLVVSLVLLMGGLELFRDPRSRMPADVLRYLRQVEREFEGVEAAKVLLDQGSWIYVRPGIVMKDRSDPVAIHVGINQPAINRAMLVDTIARIESRRYERILARGLERGESAYDFQNRGSGVVAAILAHYEVVRRIPGVEGVDVWWPRILLADILVLEPRRSNVLPRRPGGVEPPPATSR